MRKGEDLRFLDQVAVTTKGTIIRGVHKANSLIFFREDGGTTMVVTDPNDRPSRYQMIVYSTGAICNLSEQHCDQIDEHLRSKQYFDEELFTN